MTKPFGVVYVEVANAHEGHCPVRQAVELLLETLNGGDLVVIGGPVPEAEEYRAAVAVQDVPTPFVSWRVVDMDDVQVEAIFSE